MRQRVYLVVVKIVLALVPVLLSGPALALDAGGAATGIFSNFGAIGTMLVQFFLLAGIFLVGFGLLKLKENRDNPQQASLKLAFTSIIVGGLLTVVLGIMTIAPDSTGLGKPTSGTAQSTMPNQG